MTYEEWLEAQYTEIQEAIEEAEEAGWHHLAASSDPGAPAKVYDRLLTWLAEVERRRDVYASRKHS